MMVACLFRGDQGRRHRGRHDAAAARQGDRLYVEQGEGRARAVRCPSRRGDGESAGRSRPISSASSIGEPSAPTRLKRLREPRLRRSPPATPQPTMSASSRSRPARPASRRGRCTFTATCWRPATASAATCSAPNAATTVFIGSPPLAFTFGLGGLVLFPAARRRLELLLERPRPTISWPASHSSARPSCSPRRPPIARCCGKLARTRCLDAAQMRLGRRGLAEGDVRCLARGDRHRASSTASAPPRCCTSSSARRKATSARARPASRCRAMRRSVVDENGAQVPPGTVGRLAVRGPTGCRYLADERQREYVAERLELSQATPI